MIFQVFHDFQSLWEPWIYQNLVYYYLYGIVGTDSIVYGWENLGSINRILFSLLHIWSSIIIHHFFYNLQNMWDLLHSKKGTFNHCNITDLKKVWTNSVDPDEMALGSSLTGVTALWSFSKTHLSQLSTGSTQEEPSLYN